MLQRGSRGSRNQSLWQEKFKGTSIVKNLIPHTDRNLLHIYCLPGSFNKCIPVQLHEHEFSSLIQHFYCQSVNEYDLYCLQLDFEHSMLLFSVTNSHVVHSHLSMQRMCKTEGARE